MLTVIRNTKVFCVWIDDCYQSHEGLVSLTARDKNICLVLTVIRNIKVYCVGRDDCYQSHQRLVLSGVLHEINCLLLTVIILIMWVFSSLNTKDYKIICWKWYRFMTCTPHHNDDIQWYWFGNILFYVRQILILGHLFM